MATLLKKSWEKWRKFFWMKLDETDYFANFGSNFLIFLLLHDIQNVDFIVRHKFRVLGTGCLKKIQFYPEKIPPFLSRCFYVGHKFYFIPCGSLVPIKTTLQYSSFSLKKTPLPLSCCSYYCWMQIIVKIWKLLLVITFWFYPYPYTHNCCYLLCT